MALLENFRKVLKVFLSVSLIEPVVSHDATGGSDHSSNDRDVFFEQTLSLLQI